MMSGNTTTNKRPYSDSTTNEEGGNVPDSMRSLLAAAMGLTSLGAMSSAPSSSTIDRVTTTTTTTGGQSDVTTEDTTLYTPQEPAKKKPKKGKMKKMKLPLQSDRASRSYELEESSMNPQLPFSSSKSQNDNMMMSDTWQCTPYELAHSRAMKNQKKKKRKSTTSHKINQRSWTTTTAATTTTTTANDSNVVTLNFPEILYEIIMNEKDYGTVISWLSHGRGFIIHDKNMFQEKVLMPHFDGAKYTSFTRRLKRWNFERVSRGPEMGAYYNKFFMRGRKDLVQSMMYGSESDEKISEQLEAQLLAGPTEAKKEPSPSVKEIETPQVYGANIKQTSMGDPQDDDDEEEEEDNVVSGSPETVPPPTDSFLKSEQDKAILAAAAEARMVYNKMIQEEQKRVMIQEEQKRAVPRMSMEDRLKLEFLRGRQQALSFPSGAMNESPMDMNMASILRGQYQRSSNNVPSYTRPIQYPPPPEPQERFQDMNIRSLTSRLTQIQMEKEKTERQIQMAKEMMMQERRSSMSSTGSASQGYATGDVNVISPTESERVAAQQQHQQLRGIEMQLMNEMSIGRGRSSQSSFPFSDVSPRSNTEFMNNMSNSDYLAMLQRRRMMSSRSGASSMPFPAMSSSLGSSHSGLTRGMISKIMNSSKTHQEIMMMAARDLREGGPSMLQRRQQLDTQGTTEAPKATTSDMPSRLPPLKRKNSGRASAA